MGSLTSTNGKTLSVMVLMVVVVLAAAVNPAYCFEPYPPAVVRLNIGCRKLCNAYDNCTPRWVIEERKQRLKQEENTRRERE